MIEKSISLANSTMYYRTGGQGMPVVLLHGFAEDQDVWRYQQEALSDHFHLIIPDLPGSGQSGMLADMSVEGMADSVHQLLEKEFPGGYPGGVVLIGHSMGGYIILAYAAKHPERLRAFGLFHSTAFPDTEEKKGARRRSIRFIRTHGSAAFIRESTPNLFSKQYRIENSAVLTEMIERYSGFDPLALVAYYEAMILRPNRITVLQSFNKPVLFIIGKQDKAIPFEDSMKQCHIPDQAAIEILDHTAHMGMWEEPETSIHALLDFLKGVSILTDS